MMHLFDYRKFHSNNGGKKVGCEKSMEKIVFYPSNASTFRSSLYSCEINVREIKKKLIPQKIYVVWTALTAANEQKISNVYIGLKSIYLFFFR